MIVDSLAGAAERLAYAQEQRESALCCLRIHLQATDTAIDTAIASLADADRNIAAASEEMRSMILAMKW